MGVGSRGPIRRERAISGIRPEFMRKVKKEKKKKKYGKTIGSDEYIDRFLFEGIEGYVHMYLRTYVCLCG